jgi:hypothetical protein
MGIVINAFGMPVVLMPFLSAAPPVRGPAKAPAAAVEAARRPERPRALPSLFRLFDRITGEHVTLAGRPIEVLSTDPAAANAELLHNRDPRRFEVRIASPFA